MSHAPRHCNRPYRRGVGDPTGHRTRRVLRLVVASPDGTRVLARPNGLAGWTLPSIAVESPFGGWDATTLAAAAAAVGGAVEPVEPVAGVADAWAMQATGRIAAVGITWIGVDELARLGHDAAVARRALDLHSGVDAGSDDRR